MFSKSIVLSVLSTTILFSAASAFADLNDSAARVSLALQDETVMNLLSSQAGADANIDQASYSPANGTVSIRSGKCTVRVQITDEESVQEGRNPIELPTVNENSARITCAQ